MYVHLLIEWFLSLVFPLISPYENPEKDRVVNFFKTTYWFLKLNKK